MTETAILEYADKSFPIVKINSIERCQDYGEKQWCRTSCY